MGKTKDYQHYCPVARTLEVIGEKWSLLIVRDLLRGPQRFTDLFRYLGRITPKWLTLRLRDLEAAGIVERDSQPGRREVWYRLTAKGRELAPVVEALAVWGIDHAMRPPAPDEPIYPEQTVSAMAIYFNAKGLRLPHPATWEFRFGDDPQLLRFDGDCWQAGASDSEADVVIETTPERWVALLLARPDERARLLDPIDVGGSRDRVADFRTLFAKRRSAQDRRLSIQVGSYDSANSKRGAHEHGSN